MTVSSAEGRDPITDARIFGRTDFSVYETVLERWIFKYSPTG